MAKYAAAINAIKVALQDTLPVVSEAAAGGLTKLMFRYGVGITTTANIDVVLTPAEEAAVLVPGVKYLLKKASKYFLYACIIDLGVKLLQGEHEKKPFGLRLEIIAAHISKPGNLWAKAAGVAEQVVFIVHDTFAEAIPSFVQELVNGPGMGVPGIVTFASPNQWPDPTTREFSTAFITPIEAASPETTLIEAAGWITTPIQSPDLTEAPTTFPVGPRPSFGQRH